MKYVEYLLHEKFERNESNHIIELPLHLIENNCRGYQINRWRDFFSYDQSAQCLFKWKVNILLKVCPPFKVKHNIRWLYES